MNKLTGILLLTGMICAAMELPGAEPERSWDIRSLSEEHSVVYNLNTEMMTAPKGAVVKYGDATLTAQFLELNQKTGEAVAEGMVTLQQDGFYWTGERLEYNFHTRQLKADEFRAGSPPFFVAGLALSGDATNEVYGAYKPVMTTDDVDDPGHHIRARTIVIVPGRYLEARHATVYLGKVPVFYWPTYRRRLDGDPNNFTLTPGYRSRYGLFLLSAYNWQATESFGGAMHLDYRLKRGLGAGPDFHYDLGRWGLGEFGYYYAYDDDPDTNLVGRAISEHRQRAFFTHKADLRTNLTARAVVRYQSDEFVIRDFFESEYRKNVQPSTFLEVNQLWSDFSLNLLAQPRINHFFETVERLPDVKLTAARQQLGALPLFYESDSSIGYYQRQFARDVLDDYAAWRGDTYHQVVYPHTFFGWLTVTPRVGGRFTHYGEGHGVATDEESRFVFNTGAEASLKASRVWPGVSNRLLEVDGLRHIVQPSINYAWVPRPNERPPDLPQFDSELPSFRLLPIEFPDYNAIDSIDSQNVFRFGLRNKLQTKRGDEIQHLVNWALYTDWRLRPRTGQGTFADLFSDLDFRPRSWLVLNSETRFDLDRADWRYAFHTLTVTPNNTWSLSLGHRYLRTDAALGLGVGNNLFSSSFYYRMNENWGFRVSHLFEARDGTLEEQYYTVYRDLRSWTSALTLRLRESRTGSDDWTIAVTFSLKAFPRFGLERDTISPSYLLGS